MLTTGSANSTILTKLAGRLGWQLNDADDEYAESVTARQLNMQFLGRGLFDSQLAIRMLSEWKQPWIVKDPRFSQTLSRWLPLLRPYKPLLFYVSKDVDYVAKSMARRFGSNGKMARKRADMCRDHFLTWPYAKLHIDVEQIDSALSLYSPSRSRKYRDIQE